MKAFALAFSQSTARYGHTLNPELNFVTNHTYGREVIKAVVEDFRNGVVTSATALPGNCFDAIREASYVLFEMGIDNAITIGNTCINGSPRFSTTADSITLDLEMGFKPFEHITNAHAWLTLDSGQILDPTIIPSWAYHSEGREISLDEAIHLEGVTEYPKIEYSPFLTGFAYHLQVLSDPLFLPEKFLTYTDWFKHSLIFKQNIQNVRKKEQWFN